MCPITTNIDEQADRTEWNDAIAIVSSMFGLNGIVLYTSLEGKLSYLKHFGVEFDIIFTHMQGDTIILKWLIPTFIIVLFTKNSIQKLDEFTYNRKNTWLSLGLFIIGVLSLHKVSEFLYFNF